MKFYLYKKITSDTVVSRFFLSGLMKRIDILGINGLSERIFYLLKFKVFSKSIDAQCVKYSFLGRMVFRVHLKKFIFKELFKKLSREEELRCIIVLRGNSGEISIFARSFLRQIIDKYDVNLIVCTKAYQESIVKLYFPDIRIIHCKSFYFNYLSDEVIFDGIKIKTFFTNTYFLNFEKQYKRKEKNGLLNYFSWMENYVKEGFFDVRVEYSEPVIKNACNLQTHSKEREIIVFDSAKSNDSLSDSEVNKIIKTIKESGFSAVFNDEKISHQELYKRAKNAAGFIGVRSGIFDFLAPLEKPAFIIYKSFPKRGVDFFAYSPEEVRKMFSLSNLPNINNRGNLLEVLDQEDWDLSLKKWIRNI